jgi:hypothetical protein
MYWLEGGHNLMRIFSEPSFRPTSLTITIRYSDWWFWENNEPLRMEERWLKVFEGPPGLKELRVEYETLSWKREEMMKIVERNKKWKLALRNEEADGQEQGQAEGHLSAEKTELVEWKWKGPSELDGQKWQHHGDGDEVEYVVVTDTWRFVKGPMSAEDAEARGPAQRITDGYWSDIDEYHTSADEYESEYDEEDSNASDEEGSGSDYDEDES